MFLRGTNEETHGMDTQYSIASNIIKNSEFFSSGPQLTTYIPSHKFVWNPTCRKRGPGVCERCCSLPKEPEAF